MEDNNGRSTSISSYFSSAQNVIRKESYPISQSNIHPRLEPGRDQEAPIFETGNLTASNLAQIAETPHTLFAMGSAFVSAVHPQYPSEVSCGQVSGNITGNIGPDHGVPNKQLRSWVQSEAPRQQAEMGAQLKPLHECIPAKIFDTTVTEASALEKRDGIRSSEMSKGRLVSDH